MLLIDPAKNTKHIQVKSTGVVLAETLGRENKYLLLKEEKSTVKCVLRGDQKKTSFLVNMGVYLYSPKLSLWIQIFWIFITA